MESFQAKMKLGGIVGRLPRNPLGLQGKPPTARNRAGLEFSRSWDHWGLGAFARVAVLADSNSLKSPSARLIRSTDPSIRQ